MDSINYLKSDLKKSIFPDSISSNILLTSSFVDMKNIIINHIVNTKWLNLNLIDTTIKINENHFVKTYITNVKLFEIDLESDYDRESFLTNNKIRNDKNIIIINSDSELIKHINRLKTMVRYLFIIIDNRNKTMSDSDPILSIADVVLDSVVHNKLSYSVGYFKHHEHIDNIYNECKTIGYDLMKNFKDNDFRLSSESAKKSRSEKFCLSLSNLNSLYFILNGLNHINKNQPFNLIFEPNTITNDERLFRYIAKTYLPNMNLTYLNKFKSSEIESDANNIIFTNDATNIDTIEYIRSVSKSFYMIAHITLSDDIYHKLNKHYNIYISELIIDQTMMGIMLFNSTVLFDYFDKYIKSYGLNL